MCWTVSTAHPRHFYALHPFFFSFLFAYGHSTPSTRNLQQDNKKIKELLSLNVFKPKIKAVFAMSLLWGNHCVCLKLFSIFSFCVLSQMILCPRSPLKRSLFSAGPNLVKWRKKILIWYPWLMNIGWQKAQGGWTMSAFHVVLWPITLTRLVFYFLDN